MMKGYALLLLAAAVLLMLLPLPALFGGKAVESPPPPAEAPPGTPTTDSFRLLVGDEVVTLEAREFLIRTLAFELSPHYHPEALKAQAVAAYTYYGRRRLAQESSPDAALHGAHFKTPDSRFPHDYSPDKLREKWSAQYDAYYQALSAAVDAVLRHHIVYGNEWIDACYFAISHGVTEDASTVWGSDIPYLRSVASPADKLAAGYEHTVTLPADAVKQALLAADSALTLGDNPADWFGAAEKSPTGSLKSITVGGNSLSATTLRTALGLRSTHITIEWQPDGFHFTTRGYGHGVGMSQQGADALARQGYTWQEILQYYYTDVTIV